MMVLAGDFLLVFMWLILLLTEANGLFTALYVVLLLLFYRLFYQVKVVHYLAVASLLFLIPFLLLVFFRIQILYYQGFVFLQILIKATLFSLLLVLKMIAVFLSVVLFAINCRERELFHLYRKMTWPLRWLLPVDDGEVTLMICLRFLPELRREFANLRYFHQLKQGRSGSVSSWWRGGSGLFAMLIPLLEKVLRNSRQLAIALIEKGFLTGGNRTFLVGEELATTASIWSSFIFYGRRCLLLVMITMLFVARGYA